jgi:hypothetical protein
MSKFKHHSNFPKERDRYCALFPFVCCACRKCFRQPYTVDSRRCPQCSGAMAMVSRKFSAPKMADVAQWQKVQYLIEHGFLFQSVHATSAPGVLLRVKYPKTLAEAKRFVIEHQAQAISVVPKW